MSVISESVITKSYCIVYSTVHMDFQTFCCQYEGGALHCSSALVSGVLGQRHGITRRLAPHNHSSRFVHDFFEV